MELGGLTLVAEKMALCRDLYRWRDPDSNRGHHDFQLAPQPLLLQGKVLQECGSEQQILGLDTAGFGWIRAGLGLVGG